MHVSRGAWCLLVGTFTACDVAEAKLSELSGGDLQEICINSLVEVTDGSSGVAAVQCAAEEGPNCPNNPNALLFCAKALLDQCPIPPTTDPVYDCDASAGDLRTCYTAYATRAAPFKDLACSDLSSFVPPQAGPTLSECAALRNQCPNLFQTCGDGVVQFLAGEECDDGNSTNGDGCSACRVE